MRIRLSQLRRIIKEEVSRVMNEAPNPKRKAFRDLRGSYEHLVEYLDNLDDLDEDASTDQVKKINDYFEKVVAANERHEPLYGSRDSIKMGKEDLDTQVWLLVNRAVELGPVELGQGRLKPLKSFDDVGAYIDNNPELAEYTEDERAGHEQANLVNPGGVRFTGD